MPVTKIRSSWSSGELIFHESASVAPSATYNVLKIGTTAVKIGDTGNDIDFQYYGTGSLSAIIDCGAATLTLTGIALTTNSTITTSAGGIITTGRIREVMTPADVDAQNNTLTVAQIAGGIVVHTSVTGGGTVTTDTAAHIIAGSSGVGALTADGQTIACYYVNDGDQVLTLAGGTDVTIADAGQTVAENESVLLLFRRTGATTVTMYTIGA
jgi:hypothetical protein